MNEIPKNTILEVTGALVDKSFAALAMAAGFPSAAILSPFAKGLVVGLIKNCYNDYAQRTLSISETKKLNTASQIALEVFMELSEKDRILPWEISIDPSYEEYAYEVADHVILEAIRQSETKKAEVLGRYYGKRIYQGPGDWQDMHQIIMMAGTLTYRQVVLIRLICEGFIGISSELFVTNPSACVEINRMQDYGLWMTDMAMFKDDASARVQLKLLKPTEYAKMVNDALMLEKLTNDDLKRTIDSLALSDEGEPAKGITEEDYEASNTWHYDEGEAKITIGKNIKDIATSPEDMTHTLRGKDQMKEATDYVHQGEYMKAIDQIMNALQEFKMCKSEMLYQSSIDDALKDLINIFEGCEKHGGLRILAGKSKKYESVLADLKSEYLQKCHTYLQKSEEKDEKFDGELYDQEINSLFKI